MAKAIDRAALLIVRFFARERKSNML